MLRTANRVRGLVMMKQATVPGRRPWAGLAGAALVLTVTGCGSGTNPAETAGPNTTAAATSAASSAGGSTEPTPSAIASPAEPTVSPTASATAGGGSSQDAQPRDEVFTTEAGTVSLSIPAGWTVSCVVCSDSSAQPPAGVTERYEITDKDDDIIVNLTTVSGARDGDGAYPALVETLEAEPLTSTPSHQEDASVYFLAQHLAENPEFEMSSRWGAATEGLLVEVADLPDAVDPNSPESVQAAWIHVMTDEYPVKDFTGLYLRTSIPLPMVEALTGEQGDEAMRAFLSTTEYRELKRMMSSVAVHEDAIPDFEDSVPSATTTP
ncbi:hypothetical protein [Citricoccus sp. I39-566]|nr:hypothetical protein [Citricoccus sp. I39-566]WMY79053.1 hypothetical protein RE421_04075 [Citricoccus sp. I39-566]